MVTRLEDNKESNEAPKLSLFAQFDDICRLTSSFRGGVEDELIKFMESSKSVNKKQTKIPNAKINKLKNVIDSQKRRIKVLETQLKHARSLVTTEMNKARKAETEKKILDSKIQAIAQLLLSKDTGLNEEIKDQIVCLSTTSFNVENPSEMSSQPYQESSDSVCLGISFDTTSDDMDTNEFRREYKPFTKPNAAPIPISSKSTIQTDFSDKVGKYLDEKCQTLGKRQSKEPQNSDPSPMPNPNLKSSHSSSFTDDRDKGKGTYFTCRSSFESYTTIQSQLKMSISNKQHNFRPKPSLYIRRCICCDRRLVFWEGSSECSECKVVCHNECKANMPLPCIPIPKNPISTKKRKHIHFVPLSCSPEIHNIMQCIREVDKRGLREADLYYTTTTTTSDEEVKKLAEKMLKLQNFPGLNHANIHVVCETIKYFLKMLTDPLIPRFLWADIICSFSHDHQHIENRIAACYSALKQIPKLNLATLALLISHLHRVAKSTNCRINYSKLADIFGPIILGSNLPGSRIPPDANQLKRNQYEMMYVLFSIPINYWKSLESMDAP